MKLYGYWRSSAAFRVRIALNLKGVPYTYQAVNIAPQSAEQLGETYLALNPEGRVPCLVTEDGVLGQSMAILEWLEETQPTPSLLPETAWDRAKCRAFANTIACDIHPLNNSSVLRKLTDMFDASDAAATQWYQDWINRGFGPLEAKVQDTRSKTFLFGDRPSLAEILLVPQIWNARRFGIDMTAFPGLSEIESTCYKLQAFDRAKPENQPDAS